MICKNFAVYERVGKTKRNKKLFCNFTFRNSKEAVRVEVGEFGSAKDEIVPSCQQVQVRGPCEGQQVGKEKGGQKVIEKASKSDRKCPKRHRKFPKSDRKCPKMNEKLPKRHQKCTNSK